MTLKIPATAWAGAIWLVAAGPAAAATVSMDALVAKALTHVPALEAARATARAQHDRIGVAQGAYWPQIGLGAGYARAYNVPPAAFDSAAGDGGVANLSLHQELFNFGMTDAAVEAASAAADATDAQARNAAVDVSYAVRVAYLQWAEARGLAKSAEEQVQNSTKLLDQAKSFYKNGVSPRIDVTRATVVLAESQASLADARNNIEIARRSLETAIGGEVVTGEPSFPQEPALIRRSRAELDDQARKSHPSLAASDAQLRAARAATKGADRARLPDLSANAIYGARAQEVALGPDWQAGLNVSMPLFTGFALDKQVAAAHDAEQAASASLADRGQQVDLGVDRSYIAIGGAREKLAAFKTAQSSAKENFQLARNRYRDGVGSIIEVSEAQALLANAEADEVRGEAAYHLAIAALQDAVGLTGLETTEGTRP